MTRPWAFLALLLASSALPALAIRSGRVKAKATVATAKNRPVSKVTALLKEMLSQLQKEADEDDAMYKKMACWCAENEKATGEAIEEEERRLRSLASRRQALSAEVGGLRTESGGLHGEVEGNRRALEKATALRERQLADFRREERELVQSITELRSAITVLSKHHEEASLLQLSHADIVASTMEAVMKRHGSMLQGALTPEQTSLAMAFIASLGSNQDSSAAFRQEYSPGSGQIYGILQQMLETFERNLKSAQEEELRNQRAYEGLAHAKEDEISAGERMADKKEGLVAGGEDSDAHMLADEDNTQHSLEADRRFLLKLKDQCSMTDEEWEKRQRTRQQEMQAVSKAITILTNDDAHELFSKTFNPDFLQTDSVAALQHSHRRQRAALLLASAAEKVRSGRLSVLAGRVKIDAFGRVKRSIEEMVAQLGREKADEAKKKDFCIDEFHENEKQTERKHRERQEVETDLEDLEMRVHGLHGDLEKLEHEVREINHELKRAGEDREKENHEFQGVVSDQRETVRLLQAARSVLEDFYGHQQPSLLSEGQSPPGEAAEHRPNGSGGGVIDLIEHIIGDAKRMEAEAVRSEGDAQRGYEEFVKDSNAVMDAKSREIVEKHREAAAAEAEVVEAKKAEGSLHLELEQLENSRRELHGSCDFLLKNYEARQTARDEEVDALQRAKAILSGAKLPS